MASNGKIAIIFSDFKNDYNDGYILGIQKQANIYGYQTFTFSMPQSSELYTNEEEWVFELIDYDLYDGVIFVERSFAAHRNLIVPIEESLKTKCHCPIVVIGASENFPNVVRLENQNGFEKVAEHLISAHGCQNIFCLGGDRNIPDSRIDGFIHVMQKNGLPCGEDNVLYGGYWIPCAETLAKDIAYGNVEKPDAVMCVNDEIAYALIKKLYHYGVRVPEDLLVTGFDNAPYAMNDALTITTFEADTKHCGCRAMALLYAQITGQAPETIPAKQLHLITGESCGCGTKRAFNIRAKLDLLQKLETANMEYRNSRFEEKLYQVNTQEEFSQFIKNHKYLIRDQISVSVNRMERDAEEATCIYLKDYLINGETVPFRAKNLYPDLFSFGAIKNVHILPLVFDRRIYGFMTIGYAEENVFTYIAKQFANRLAIGMEILAVRQNTVTSEPQMEQDETEDEIFSVKQDAKKAVASIFVIKEGSMHKVLVDNILYFESFDKRVYAALKSGKYEVKQRLFEIEELLAEKNFYRISKSILANMDKVVGYKTATDRTLCAMLVNKDELRVSRNYMEDFKKKLALR